MAAWMDDLVHAWRRLRQRPALTFVASATLALGLGANIAIFTLVYAVALQPLPVREPGQLYRLGDNSDCCVNSGIQSDYSLFSYPLYKHLRAQTGEFSTLAGFQAQPQPLSLRRAGAEASQTASAQYVSANYFSTMGVVPAAGRLLEERDDQPDAPPVFVMSHQVWRDQFGGDPGVVGASFVAGGKTLTLVGVAEERFFGETRRPDPPGLFLPLGIELQMRGSTALSNSAPQNWLRIIGRLPAGGRVAVAQSQADAALRQWLGGQPFITDEQRDDVARARTPIVSASAGVEMLRMAFQQPLTILFVMSGLVLLIAAANLANLLLAHSDRGQAAIRLALGASPSRLVRQSFAEGVVLALVGAGAGILVASLATKAVVALAFANVAATTVDLAPSWTVLGFAVGLALLTGALFSAGPALVLSRTDPIGALRGAGRGGESRGVVPRGSLVVVQVALSLVLLTGAGLLSSSLSLLQNQPLGFEPEDRIMVRLDLPASYAGDVDRLVTTYRRLREEFGRVPGVRGVTYSLYTPMQDDNWSSNISVDGRDTVPGAPTGSSWNRIGPKYFETLGTRVIRGRAIAGHDSAAALPEVVVNEAFVRRFIDSGEPLGRRVGIGDQSHARDFEIVGVTEDVKYSRVEQATRPMMFLPDFYMPPNLTASQRSVMARSMLMRMVSVQVGPGTGSIEPQLRQAIARVDPAMSITRVMPMTEQVAGNFRMNVLMARLTAAYGILALALASLGLYAVTAYTVAKRTREIGIRMALGADRTRIVRDVVKSALGHTTIGLIAGVPAALLSSGAIATQLYGVQPRDPVVLASAAVVLIVSAVAAAVGPALRASRVDPTRALRAS